MLTKSIKISLIIIAYFLTATLLAPHNTTAAITDGLIAHWTFDEGSNTTAEDSAGNFTGTLINGPTWITGKIGNGALQFDGIDDYIDAGSQAMNISDSLTLSAWIRPDGSGSGFSKAIISRGQHLYPFWLQHQSTNNLRVSTRTNTDTYYLTLSNAVELNTWHHIVVTYKNGSRIVYVDGVLVASDAPSGTLNSPDNSQLTIGAMFDGSSNFEGAIDDVRIYNRALSSTEVTELYNYTGDSTPTPSGDTNAPTTPTDLSATTISSSQINLSWNASTDDTGVAGYYIHRNGTQIATVTNGTSYNNTGLSANTNYSYTVSAYDAAGNVSGQSSSVSATTLTESTSGDTTTDTTCASISQYGITWTFDQEYPCGTFANDDYWVVGPVVITSITPDFNGVHNGWEVNPVNSGPQGLEIGAGEFSADLVPSLPYTAQPGSSILKGISVEQNTSNTGDCYQSGCLSTAAVLTVLATVPPNNGTTVFRPSYIGKDKTLYSINDLQLNLLPSLQPVSSAPSIDSMINTFNRVQMDHKGGRMGRIIKPSNNVPDNYGGSIGRDIGNSILRLMLNNPLDEKMPLLIHIVQGGIDRYHAVLSGQTWPSGGGHEPGRKLSLAFAAVMLDNQNMKTVVKNYKQSSEDKYIQIGFNDTPLFGGVEGYWTEESYWNFINNDPGYNVEISDPYGYIDGGSNETRTHNGYQFCCLAKPWQATTLALWLMPEMIEIFDTPKLLTYMDRFVTQFTWTQPDPCAPVSQGGGPLLNTQGNYQGKCILDPDLDQNSPLVLGTGTDFTCLPGRECGRYPNRHGTSIAIHYGTAFQDNMWDTYRSQATGIPPADTTPPARSSGTPNNTLATGTTSATISLITNETATCRYGTIANTAYTNLPSTFANTNSNNHSANLTSLSDGTTYTYYVRCRDNSDNTNTTDYSIQFSVGTDTTAPTLSNGSPSNELPAGRTSTTISLTSNEPATCRYASTTNTSYSNMTNTFTTTGNTSHSTGVNNLSNNSATTYYIRCADNSNNVNTSDYSITVRVAAATPTTGTPPTSGGGGGNSSSGGGDDSSSSDNEDIVTTPTTDTTAPSRPSELKAITSGNNITLQWSNPDDTNFVGVQIVRRTSAAEENASALEILADADTIFEGNLDQFTDTEAKAGQKYHYYILAYDQAGNYSQAQSISITPDNTKEDQIVNALPTRYSYQHLANLASSLVNTVSRSEAVEVNDHQERVPLSSIETEIYDKIISPSVDVLTESARIRIAYFIHTGTYSTTRLGAGERAGVINSFTAAFEYLPRSENDWQDVIKIANGRWPAQTNSNAESKATMAFKKIYLREPNRNNPNDDAAVTVMTYGLRPVNRNLDSEKVAIKSFLSIYGHNPESAIDWDIVRAIAYSGAVR